MSLAEFDFEDKPSTNTPLNAATLNHFRDLVKQDIDNIGLTIVSLEQLAQVTSINVTQSNLISALEQRITSLEGGVTGPGVTYDKFDDIELTFDNTLGSGTSVGNVFINSSGEMEVAPTSIIPSYSFRDLGIHDLNESYIYVEIDDPSTGPTTETGIWLHLDDTRSIWFFVTNGDMYSRYRNGTDIRDLNLGSWDSINDRFLRISESGTDILWHSSPDGSTWGSALRTVAEEASFPVTALRGRLFSGYYGDVPAVGTAKFGGVNVPGGGGGVVDGRGSVVFNTNGDRVNLTGGSFDTNGAFSIVAFILVDPTTPFPSLPTILESFSDTDLRWIIGHDASADVYQMFVSLDGGATASYQDTSTSDEVIPGQWVKVAVTKASGSNAVRFHVGSTHGAGIGAIANAVVGTGLKIGDGTDDQFYGNIAAVAGWNSALTDGNIDSIQNFEDILDLTPNFAVDMGQLPVVATTGGMTVGAVTSTPGESATPPTPTFWTASPGGGGGGTGGEFVFYDPAEGEPGDWTAWQDADHSSDFGNAGATKIDILPSPIRSGELAYRYRVNQSTGSPVGPRAEHGDWARLYSEGDDTWFGDILFVPSGQGAWGFSHHTIMQLGHPGAAAAPQGLVIRDAGWGSDTGLFVILDNGGRLIVPMANMTGRAIPIELHVRWSQGNQGLVECWVDGAYAFGVNKVTLGGPTGYFKQGQYGEAQNKIIWWHGAKAGPTRESVLR